VAVLAAASLLALGLLVALFAWGLVARKKKPPDFTLVDLPVVKLPVFQLTSTVSAETAGLPDDAVVVGVEAGGRHRAYLLEALFSPDFHVINDLLGGKPITVTYCNMTDCLAVFTAPKSDKPLEIAVGGWQGRMVYGKYEGSMLLREGSTWYRQDNGQQPTEPGGQLFPYDRTEYKRTTWKEWTDKHKDTDVFVGEVVPDGAGTVNEGATAP